MPALKIAAKPTHRLSGASGRGRRCCFRRAGDRLLGAAGGAAREVRTNWPRTTTSARSRCARRAAWCSTATAACWSRTATRTASRSSASTPRTSTGTIQRAGRRCSGLDEGGVRTIVDRHRREPTYRPITIVQDATLAQVAAVIARRLDSNCRTSVVEQVPTRRYPETMGAHLFGLRRRGQRRAGRRQRRHLEERRHHRPVGHREGLQRAI